MQIHSGHGRSSALRLAAAACTSLAVFSASAQEPMIAAGDQITANDFKRLSLDELMDLEITLVNRTPHRLAETPSAVQVITSEQIRRSGALSLPEALRLAPNLPVAQVNAHDWAITARGFNGAGVNVALSNKLLVMIDGRSVYTPLFGGVFWDVQNVLLEDIDRIEVVSGPGGSLWGANAVNGVINIVSKSARETQGLYLSGAAGNFWEHFGAVRYGGTIAPNLYYRVYGQSWGHDGTETAEGVSGQDQWRMHQGGMRLDYYPSRDDTFTLQGDVYNGNLGDPDTALVSGGNVLGRWTHVFSPRSDFQLQFYFDGTWRELPPSGFADAMRTYDLDFQHRFPIGDAHEVLWGLGYRLSANRTDDSPAISFSPSRRNLPLISGFVQDEITLVPDRLRLTVGAKLEYNDYSGFELQPSARIAWQLDERSMVWGAVSRAVRSPSRFDVDEVAPSIVTPGGDFDSEKLIAYELGYRVRPLEVLSLSIAAFYNRYDELRSVNVDPSDPPPPFMFANDQEAETWGVELAADLQMMQWWRLRGGYTYLDKNIRSASPTVVPGADAFEGNDPYNQIVVQSMMDLPGNLELDLVGRYVGALAAPEIPSYFSLDARLAWRRDNLELAIVGQNLLDNSHPEFGSLEIPRSFYGQVTVRW